MKTVFLNSGGLKSVYLAKAFSNDELHSLHARACKDPEAKAAGAQAIANRHAATHSVVPISQPYVTPLTLIGLGLSYAHVLGAGRVIWGLTTDTVASDFGDDVRYLVDLRYPKQLIADDVPMRDIRDLIGATTRSQILGLLPQEDRDLCFVEPEQATSEIPTSPMRAVFLNGGGLDSLLTAKAYRARGWMLHSIYVHYGDQSQDRENISAERIAQAYCMDHSTVRLDVRWLFDKRTPESAHRGLVSARPVFLGAAQVLCQQKQVDTILWNAGFTATISGYADVASRLLSPVRLFNSDMPDSMLTDAWRAKATEYGVTREEAEDTCSCTSAVPCGLCYKCKTRQRLELAREAL